MLLPGIEPGSFEIHELQVKARGDAEGIAGGVVADGAVGVHSREATGVVAKRRAEPPRVCTFAGDLLYAVSLPLKYSELLAARVRFPIVAGGVAEDVRR